MSLLLKSWSHNVRHLAGSLLLLMTLIAAPFSSANAVLGDVTSWPADTAELHKRLQRQVEYLGIPAASVIVFDARGNLWQQHYGTAADDPRPLYQVGNLSEILTALAVMELLENETWGLYDRVSDHLPSLQLDNPYGAESPLRVIHLLEHASGFDQRRFKNHARDGAAVTMLEAVHRDPGTLRLRWAPGLMSRQSSVNFAVLGAMLEAHYQQNWSELVQQRVLDPLQLPDTYPHLQAAPAERVLDGHRRLPPQAKAPTPRWLLASEGVVSDVESLARLGRLLLSRDITNYIPVSQDAVGRMETPRSTLASEAGLHYGFGSGLDTRARFGYWYGKSSALGGYGSTMRYAPQYGVGYVILTNHQSMLPALEEQVWQYLVRERGGVHNMPANGHMVEDEWRGWYRLQNPENAIIAPLQQLFDLAYLDTDASDVNLYPWLSPSLPLRAAEGSKLAHRSDGSVVGAIFQGPQGDRMLQVHTDVRMQVGMFQAWGPLVLLGIALVLLLSHPFGRRDALRNHWVRTLPTLALLALVLFVYAAGSLSLEQASTDNWRSVALFVFSVLFPVFAFAGLATSCYCWRTECNKIAKIRCLLGGLAATGLAIAFWYAGWFGLRVWAW
ncbi:serine hydrolase domain-containing protein [Aliidiomarina sp. Khilg15.8]